MFTMSLRESVATCRPQLKAQYYYIGATNVMTVQERERRR